MARPSPAKSKHMPDSLRLFEKTNAMNEQNQSPFFRLPAELRNLVYTYTFCQQTPINTTRSQMPVDSPSELINLEDTPEFSPSNALLASCELIHKEAHGIFYKARQEFWSSNTFLVDLRDEWDGAADVEVKRPSDTITIPRLNYLSLIPRIVVSVKKGPHNDEFHLVEYKSFFALGPSTCKRDVSVSSPAEVQRSRREHLRARDAMAHACNATLPLNFYMVTLRMANYARLLAKHVDLAIDAHGGQTPKREQQLILGLKKTIDLIAQKKNEKVQQLRRAAFVAVLDHLYDRHKVHLRPKGSS